MLFPPFTPPSDDDDGPTVVSYTLMRKDGDKLIPVITVIEVTMPLQPPTEDELEAFLRMLEAEDDDVPDAGGRRPEQDGD